MKIDTALYQLKNHTLTFLGNNLLSLAGAARSGPRINYLSFYDGALGGSEGFTIRTSPMPSSRTGIDGKAHKALQVHSVRMIPSSEDLDVSDIEAYVLDGTGPDLMVTGQLSACVFAVRQEPGRLIVGHIQPGGSRQTGTTLRQTIKLMGRFHGHGRVTHVFGMGDYNARAHVVGIRRAGNWQIFAQQVASGSGPVQGAVQII